jgi:hypothetical protein
MTRARARAKKSSDIGILSKLARLAALQIRKKNESPLVHALQQYGANRGPSVLPGRRETHGIRFDDASAKCVFEPERKLCDGIRV